MNGAKAAGVDDVVGTLSPGKRADIVLLEMGGVSQAGWNRHEPGGAIIAQANSGNVDTVLVDGRVVKRGGSLVHVDVAAALCASSRSRTTICTSRWKQRWLHPAAADRHPAVPRPSVVQRQLNRNW